MDKNTKRNRAICVFCGSSSGDRVEYTKLAEDTGHSIHKHRYSLVYGGGGTGLMGSVARSMRDAGGQVLGIIPTFLMKAEHALEGIEREIVPDMHTRKHRMYEVGDAFIILPGGIGTMEEAIEILCWQRLQLHQKPIVFLSDNDYWNPLMAFIKQTITSQFSPDWLLDDITVCTSASDAMKYIHKAWKAPQKELRPLVPISKV